MSFLRYYYLKLVKIKHINKKICIIVSTYLVAYQMRNRQAAIGLEFCSILDVCERSDHFMLVVKDLHS